MTFVFSIWLLLAILVLVSAGIIIHLYRKMHNMEQKLARLEETDRSRLVTSMTQRNMTSDEYFMTRVNEIMERHMADSSLTIKTLADELHMGRSAVFTRFKRLTGLSPVEFIREQRIQRAAQLLQDKQYNISEVAYRVGMNDSRYFAKCFKNTYGVTPSEYRH